VTRTTGFILGSGGGWLGCADQPGSSGFDRYNQDRRTDRGFVFGQRGLMYNLTLEGSKFAKLDKKK
jgi:hypothetical protein